MKPIAPQDRPKVIAMVLALVLVLGFVAKTAIGLMSMNKGGSATPSNPPNPAPSGPVATAVSPLPGGTSSVPAPGPETTPTPGRAPETEGPVDPFRRVLPEGNRSAPPPRPLPAGNGGGTGPAPVRGDLGGGTVAPAPIPEPAIRLAGILIDSDRIAVVSSDHGTEMYRVGALIFGMFRVLRIEPEQVFFRGPRGTFTLRVGESHEGTVPSNQPTAPSPGPTPAATPSAEVPALPLPGFLRN